MTAVLAFDTATPATTVALCAEDGPAIEARDDPAPGQRPGHANRLLPLCREVLKQADLEWPDLSSLAVGTGPGTFTGLRIGLATARGLARGLGLSLTGVSTLRSLAANALDGESAAGSEAVLAVLDARRREVFAAAWPLGSEGLGEDALLAPQALAPDALAARAAEWEIPLLALGNGAVEFRSVLERSRAIIPGDGSTLHRVTASNHCRLARALVAGAPDDVHPEYLRLPDAELARRTAHQT